MPTSTTNYGLIKPDTTDPILIGQLNDNSDAIDAALKENADAIESKPDAADIPTPSTAAPAMDGTAAAGTSTDYARSDHVHPSDTSKQNALSSTQLDAVNSGIDSTKVEQLETNKNNISYNEQGGFLRGKNYSPIEGGTIAESALVPNYTPIYLPIGSYTVSFDAASYSGSAEFRVYSADRTRLVREFIEVSAKNSFDFTINEAGESYYFYFNQATVTNLMIRKQGTTDTFEPYIMSNTELTAAIQAIQAQLANQ